MYLSKVDYKVPIQSANHSFLILQCLKRQIFENVAFLFSSFLAMFHGTKVKHEIHFFLHLYRNLQISCPYNLQNRFMWLHVSFIRISLAFNLFILWLVGLIVELASMKPMMIKLLSNYHLSKLLLMRISGCLRLLLWFWYLFLSKYFGRLARNMIIII